MGLKVPIEWLSSHRSPRVEDSECVLCLQSVRCFSFSDNEGSSSERLCLDCLKAAVEMVTGKIIAEV